jgi:pimeloyl-ACP methyl ester carboxylesterase
MTVAINVQDSGSGEPVLLLHGWPDSHALWRHQVAALNAAGYRTIAPDLRGFGDSDKPSDVDEYGARSMIGDVVGVLDRLSLDRVHLVGHDWGAAIAWMTATAYADRIGSLTALSVGHPAAFRTAGMRQREKSWYMLFFQFPEAEQWLSENDFANLRTWAGHPGMDEVVGRLSKPGALRASLGPYRAMAAPRTLIEPPPQLPPVEAPTLGIWSSGDPALTERQMTGSADYVAGPWRYERLDGLGHWMQLENPEKVNDLLLTHLRTHPLPSPR